MDVLLVGQTEFDLDAFADCVYKTARLGVNQPADIFPVPLSEHERLISALLQAQDAGTEPLDRRLRDEQLALRFLTYQFIFKYHPSLDIHLQGSCLNWMRLPGEPPLVLVQGNLNDWLNVLYLATKSEDKHVLVTFCSVYMYFESVVRLRTILSRFYKDTVVVDGKKYFRLRYQ